MTVDIDDGEELLIDRFTVRGRHAFRVIPERGGASAVWGDAVIEVARRGGHDIVRPRHPNTPLRTAFTGTPVYLRYRPRCTTRRCGWETSGAGLSRYLPFTLS